MTALRGFDAVARHGSFRKATHELHITPAAVSQQIKVLEGQLGQPLFHRLPSGLTLTRAGKAGLRLVPEGLATLEDAAQLMAAQRSANALCVWTAPSFAAKWLVPRLRRFVDRRPGVDVQLCASLLLIEGERTGGVISTDDLRRHGVDVAIRFGQGQYPGCRVDKLLPAAVVPLCSPPLMRGVHRLREAGDLRNHTLLHDDTPYERRPDWASWRASPTWTPVTGCASTIPRSPWMRQPKARALRCRCCRWRRRTWPAADWWCRSHRVSNWTLRIT